MDTVTAGPRARAAEQRSLIANLGLMVMGAEVGLAVAMVVIGQPWADWLQLGPAITAVSRLAAMLGSALSLVLLLLISRVPWLEREFGQDRLNWWHRKVGPYSLYLILAHVVLLPIGYAISGGGNPWHEFWSLVFGTPWMMPALVGLLFLFAVGITSYRRARHRMSYETWWLIHLFAYLGVALSFMHQIDSGTMYENRPVIKVLWILMYLQVAGIIVLHRVVTPLTISWRHKLKVEQVIRENANTVSVVVKGRNLERLGAHGGQYFGWHFLVRGRWWESHPYSLSAAPRNDRMRITVKDLGDHSNWLAQLRPGTRVAVEGPYGIFTADRTLGDRVVLIAGGVGITPIRALLEELPANTKIDLIWRASRADELPLRLEIEALASARQATIHYLVGSRRQFPLDEAQLLARVPDIGAAEVFLCGPAGLVEGAVTALQQLGVETDRIHDETFNF